MGWFISFTEEMRQWGLSGNELLVFALVNTYSQYEQGCYWGSLDYTCEVCGISRATAIRTLKSLVEHGFIRKSKIMIGDNPRTIYVATRVSKCDSQSQNDTLGGVKMRPNNNRDININNTLSYKGQTHFQKPTLEEVRFYCQERMNNVDPEQFLNFYESNGWKVGKNPMRDWKAAIRTWEKREKEIPARKRETPRRESVTAHNIRVIDEMFGTNYYEQAMGRRQPDEQ